MLLSLINAGDELKHVAILRQIQIHFILAFLTQHADVNINMKFQCDVWIKVDIAS